MRFSAASILFLLLSRTFLAGQSPYFNQIGTAQGLSQLNNFYADIDSRGLLWLSSLDGLNCYDGQKVKVYRANPGDSTALLGSNIQSGFFEDKERNLWFSTWEAVHCYDRKKDAFRHYFIKEGAENQAKLGYQVCWLDPDGGLWVVVNLSQLYRFQPKTGLFEFKTALLPHSIWAFPESRADGFLKRLSTYDETTHDVLTLFFQPDGTIKKTAPAKFDKPLFQMVGLNDSVALVSGEGFLGTLNFGVGKTDFFFTGLNYPLNAINPLPENRYFMVACGKNGIKYFDANERKMLDNPPFEGLPAKNFTKNAYWSKISPQWDWLVHTPLEGIYFGNALKKKFVTLLPGQKIQTIAEDAEGNIWAGNFGNQLFEFSPDKKLLAVHSASKKHPDSLASSRIRFLFFDRENRAWIGTWDGLRLKIPGQNKFRTCTGPENTFLHGTQLHDGRVIFTALNGGIFEAKKSGRAACGFVFEKIPAIGSDKAYTTLFQAKNGLLYACRELAGIAVFDPEQGFRMVGFLKIPGEINHWLQLPNSDFLWISTSNGLVKYTPSNGSIEIVHDKKGLANTYVQAALPDQTGSLWLSTHGGIMRYFPQRDSVHLFAESDGVSSPEFNVFAAISKQNGEIWMGNMDGISVFDPAKMPQMMPPKRPLIAQILVNDEPSDHLICQKTGATNPMEMQSIELDREQNTVSFRFALPEFGDPKRVYFLYKLVGADNVWVRTTPDETARYANLPPRKYALLVRGFNSDGVESLDMARLDLFVRPAFWETAWFRIAAMLGFLATLYAIYRNRIAQIRRENTLVQQKQTAELNALRAFINPHFLFNALNSLNSFILTKKTETANDYLAEFAQLMRRMLDHAQKPVVNLSDELELNELYIKVERQRFQFPFAFDIQIAPEIDPFDVFVPAMILQPFVENAIWHGLQNRPAGGGKLTISVRANTKHLMFTIEDNGVGRARATELKSKQGQKHRSQGLNITHLRLEKLPGENSVQTFDLLDAEGKPAGTRVEVLVDKTLSPE